jgi:hypothetical protein
LTERRNDVLNNRFLKTCEIIEESSQQVARRAAVLRASARRVRRSTLWSLP